MASFIPYGVTWNPCVGTTGDDRFNLPSATGYSESLDTSSATYSPIESGDSGYSTPPTLAEIATRRGYNQIVAVANYRAARLVAVYGYTGWTALAYQPSGPTVYPSTLFNNLKSKINWIRQREGSPTWTYKSTPAHYSVCSGDVITDFRKALAIAGTVSWTSSTTAFALLDFSTTHCTVPTVPPNDSPPADAINSVTTYGLNWNGCYLNAAGYFHGRYRRRYLTSCIVPEWMSGHTPNSVTYRFTASGYGGALAKLYCSNTDDSAATFASQNNLDNLEGSITVAAGNLDISVSASRFTSHYGAHCSYILGESDELAENETVGKYFNSPSATILLDFGS